MAESEDSSMGEYTRSLSKKKFCISPEDENYREELLEVAASFRTFDAALDEFISQRGYTGDLGNTDAKIRFIKDKFEDAAIAIDPRNMRKWFYEHKRGADRKIAFQFCFAFSLSLEETQNFFRQVYLQRGIDCHDIQEAIYYYCISHRMTYSEAQELIRKAPSTKKGCIDFESEVLFTGSIIRELDRFSSSDELLAFLRENSDQFGYNNATAYKYIRELWEKIAAPNGIANREEALLFPHKAPSVRQRPVHDVYLQVFGLEDYDEYDNNTKLFEMSSDRTLQPLVKGNDLLHPIAGECFPDRQGLEGILRGEHQSSETVRKTIILLAFYRYWASLSIQHKDIFFHPAPDDAQRCVSQIDKLLVDAGYPALYEGNPYDWIFLFASQDDYPLDAFRFFMRELFLNKEEGCGPQQ